MISFLNFFYMIPFGKKIRVGNFYVLKTSRAVGRKELAAMRRERGIADEVAKKLGHQGMPQITVGDIAGGWSVTYGPTMQVYVFLDSLSVSEDGSLGRAESESLRNLVMLVYMGSTILGDKELNLARVRIHDEFVERMSAKTGDGETAEEKAADDKVTEEEARRMRDAETIVEMMKKSAGGKDGEP